MPTLEQLDTTDYDSVSYELYVPYFGRVAVEAESRRTIAVLEGDDTAAGIAASELDEGLAEVRQDLARWIAGEADDCPDVDAKEEARTIISLLAMHDVRYLPPSLADAYREDTLGWIAGLDGDRLLNLLQWNRFRNLQASAALMELRPDMEARVLRDIVDMQAEFGFSQPVSQRVAHGMARNQAIVAMDAFESGRLMAFGANYFRDGDWSIGLRKAFQPAKAVSYTQAQHPTVIHEHLHGADETADGGLLFMTPDHGDRPRLAWLNEVVVHHMAMAAAMGWRHHFEDVHPDEFGILGLMLSGGDVKIDPKLLVEAYFEPMAVQDGFRSSLDRQLQQSFSRIFPELGSQSIIDAIALEYNAVPVTFHDAVLEHWEHKIRQATDRDAEWLENESSDRACRR